MLTRGETAVGTVFRGERLLSAWRWLATIEEVPVGYVDWRHRLLDLLRRTGRDR
jgi:hypothetical protein